VFTGQYEKIKDHWDAFVEYKNSEAAKRRSEINKKNATKKKYHHTMGQGGYKSGKPKWKKMEDDLIAKGIILETLKWNDRSRDWFYRHGGKLDSEGKCVYTKSMKKTPFPLMPLEAHQRMLKREGSIPKERRTSSHVPLGMMNIQDEHEPHQAPNRGNSGFPWKGRNFPIEAVREERKGRQTTSLR
jgi:hypothetical protein